LLDEAVVVFVRADPKPDDEIALFLRNSSIVISDSCGPDVSDKRFELHRRMKRITQPKLKLFSRETLDMSR
jgi:hypothetical protein